MVKKAAPASLQPTDLLADQPPAPRFVAAADDLIDDVLDAVLQMAPAFCEALAKHRDELQELALKVSAQKHREYAGDRVYIPATTEVARRDRGSRNAAILRDHQNGERMMLLERRYSLSRQAIWKIINSGAQAPK